MSRGRNDLTSAHITGGPSAEEPRVVAIVVAFNRAELLGRALDGLANQLRLPDRVIVVDNGSEDASASVAAAHPVVTEVLPLGRNTGGAGGFSAGIAVAVDTYRADLVWIMDDDTVPLPDALAELLRARAHYPGEPALLASRADWSDGREHPMNTPRRRVGLGRKAHWHASTVGARQIRSASFVSVLIDTRAVREVGLPVADYFLWNDDFEYTARILKRKIGLYVPSSRVIHLTKVFGASNVDPGPRFFNEVRNKVWVFTRSPALRPWEKVLYGGSTLARWSQSIRRSDDPRVLLQHLWNGIVAGMKSPRPNSAVLAGTPAAAAVEALEAQVA